MLKFTVDGKTIDGFKRFNGKFNDPLNALVMVQLEDTFELFETDCISLRTVSNIQGVLRTFCNFLADVEYCEQIQSIRFLDVVKIGEWTPGV